jgi:hypothetical protein
MIGSGVFDRHPELQVLIVHMGGELSHRSLDDSNSLGASITSESATRRPAGLTGTSGRHPTISRPTSSSTAWDSALLDCALRLKCAVWTEWCSAQITVRSHTGPKSMWGSSKTSCRARLSANRCSRRRATEYSAWLVRYRSRHPPLFTNLGGIFNRRVTP